MGGRILHISKEDIAEIIAMNGSSNFFNLKNISEDPPSIDDASAPSIDSYFESKQTTLHQNRKRKARWENTKVPIPTVPEQNNYNKTEIDELVAEIYRAIRTSDDYHSKRLDDVYYPFDNSYNWLTTHTDEMKQDIDMLQKKNMQSAQEDQN